ncbi:hypothetical protein U5801_26340 [Lamprobacter modestohalophilus]|uniref:hypothetical protein n=1 Tax=Lamprobacter modestohalophilus TaxID=1064514 RepID=UPI002ADEDE40|nr:hypothetical protein [Lamprobacter modestohalophilus]MEA1053295.1 hypothetical protein [Lamprobacter modestohalophilus]
MNTALLATIAFFFATVQQRVEALSLTPDLETAVLEQLIPAIYLERVATKCSRAEERQRLAALSAQKARTRCARRSAHSSPGHSARGD